MLALAVNYLEVLPSFVNTSQGFVELVATHFVMLFKAILYF